MEAANSEQSDQPAMRFPINLSETSTRDMAVQIYNNVYCSGEKDSSV
jgi:hypothetical protein